MGLCNCFGQCDCLIEGAGQVSVTGSGDVADPFIINGLETPFDLTSLSAALVVTPGGSDGHEPSIDLAIDPDSEAPITVTPAGLRVDCCASDPSDFALSALDCNDLREEVDGLYGDSGAMVLDPGGTTIRTLPAQGATSAQSWNRTITNNEDCPILVRVEGNPNVQADALNSGISVYLDGAFRLQVTGGGTWVGGATQRSSRFWIHNDGTATTAGETFSAITKLGDWLLIPAGASRTVESVLAISRRQNLETVGSEFEFQTPTLLAWRARRADLDIAVSG